MRVNVISRAGMRHLLAKRDRVGLFLALEDGPCGPVLIACRNLRDVFAVEEFCSVNDAVGWLNTKDKTEVAKDGKQ